MAQHSSIVVNLDIDRRFLPSSAQLRMRQERNDRSDTFPNASFVLLVPQLVFYFEFSLQVRKEF